MAARLLTRLHRLRTQPLGGHNLPPLVQAGRIAHAGHEKQLQGREAAPEPEPRPLERPRVLASPKTRSCAGPPRPGASPGAIGLGLELEGAAQKPSAFAADVGASACTGAATAGRGTIWQRNVARRWRHNGSPR